MKKNKTLHDTEGREEAMETPVLRKVRGKTAEVLRKESWPGPEKRKELEKRKRKRSLLRRP